MESEATTPAKVFTLTFATEENMNSVMKYFYEDERFFGILFDYIGNKRYHIRCTEEQLQLLGSIDVPFELNAGD